MKQWQQTVARFAEKANITPHLKDQVVRLTSFLEQIAGSRKDDELMALLAELPEKAAAAFDEGDSSALAKLKEMLKTADRDRIAQLLRLYTVFFHLVNSMEQHEITRVNRERARKATDEDPRSESIAEAIYQLKAAGHSVEEVLDIISKLDIQPTITAHPTEARRRSILNKQQDVTRMIHELNVHDLTPDEEQRLFDAVLNEISLILSTDEIRSERMKVEDEVENGLYYFNHTIWETIPRMYDDIARALDAYYGKRADLPVILRYRSWIGSDRDGNPNVTPDVTWETAIEQRGMALRKYLEELDQLRRHLSVSDKKIDISQALLDSVQQDEADDPLDERYLRRYRHEPVRRKITHMMHRIEEQLEATEADRQTILEQSEAYSADDLVADLLLIQQTLSAAGLNHVAEKGRLPDLICRAKTFGFRMAALDIREHSGQHEAVVE